MFLLILIIVEFKTPNPVKTRYTTIQLFEGSPAGPKTAVKQKPVRVKEKISRLPEKNNTISKEQNINTLSPASADTVEKKQTINLTKSEPGDTGKPDLKYASSLLDTFLVRHPEYARYILEQQARNSVKDKNNKFFTRNELETRINDELHKYISRNFPEGSEHAMNPNGGPGMQIPIDGIIDAIKKLFQ